MVDKSIIKRKFIDYIDRVIESNKLSHAYLIELSNYDDLNYVYDFIKMILCNVKYDELKNCNNPIISLIDSGNYPDLYVVSSDTSVINKSLIIDLQKEFSNKSLYDNKRIYIIKEAEKLNGFSANTILKFLEEPEEDIVAFLITDNRYHVLDTILSRCQVLSLKEDFIDIDINDQLVDFLDCVLNPNNFFIKYNYYIKELFVDKSVISEHLIDVENILLLYLEGSLKDENIRIMLEKYSDRKLIELISIIEGELPKLSFNVNYKLWCDSLFSKLIGG